MYKIWYRKKPVKKSLILSFLKSIHLLEGSLLSANYAIENLENKYLYQIETSCKTVKQYLHQLIKNPNYELIITFKMRISFLQLIGKNTVLNSKPSKKTSMCLWDKDVPPKNSLLFCNKSVQDLVQVLVPVLVQNLP